MWTGFILHEPVVADTIEPSSRWDEVVVQHLIIIFTIYSLVEEIWADMRAAGQLPAGQPEYLRAAGPSQGLLLPAGGLLYQLDHQEADCIGEPVYSQCTDAHATGGYKPQKFYCFNCKSDSRFKKSIRHSAKSSLCKASVAAFLEALGVEFNI